MVSIKANKHIMERYNALSSLQATGPAWVLSLLGQEVDTRGRVRRHTTQTLLVVSPGMLVARVSMNAQNFFQRPDDAWLDQFSLPGYYRRRHATGSKEPLLRSQ